MDVAASAEAFADLRSGLGQDGGRQVERQWAVKGRDELYGRQVIPRVRDLLG